MKILSLNNPYNLHNNQTNVFKAKSSKSLSTLKKQTINNSTTFDKAKFHNDINLLITGKIDKGQYIDRLAEDMNLLYKDSTKDYGLSSAEKKYLEDMMVVFDMTPKSKISETYLLHLIKKLKKN